MSESKKKCRRYNIDYLKYGFIESPRNNEQPMCLICDKVLSNEAMKPSRLEYHIKTNHPDKKNKDLSYFQSLRYQFYKTKTLPKMFSDALKNDIDGLKASYNISLMIAKSGKSHTIGEQLILPAIREVLQTVLKKPAQDVINKIPLSNTTVQRRIDEMAGSVEQKLCDFLKNCEFSLQIDESTLLTKESLLLGYVRYIKDEKLNQELLFVKELLTNTKGESIFLLVENFFKDKEIPLYNILSVATDGAGSMTGCHNGFIAYLKKNIPDVLAIHCVIHRQHLVAKNLSNRLNSSLSCVIKAINKITSSSLNSRLFKELCIQNDEDYCRLLLHTEVRWLSKGNSLGRFYELFDSVLEFIEDKEVSIYRDLINFKNDIAYLADLYFKINEMNLQLQGNELTLIKTKSIITTFISKLIYYKQNLAIGQFYQFPKLLDLKENGKITEDDIKVYCDHLGAIHVDFTKRFEDILNLNIPNWIVDPFSSVEGTEIEFQEEIIELTNNEELTPKFNKGYQKFWIQHQISKLYPKLWSVVKRYLIVFPSTYLVERGFSAVTDLLSKKRNRLQIINRGDLRLLLTNIEPDIEKLILAHQAHPSH